MVSFPGLVTWIVRFEDSSKPKLAAESKTEPSCCYDGKHHEFGTQVTTMDIIEGRQRPMIIRVC